MQHSAEQDPFDTTNIIGLPPLHHDPSSAWSGFQEDAKLENSFFFLAETAKEALPALQLRNFQLAVDDVSLEYLELSSASAYDTADDDHDNKNAGEVVPRPEDAEDVWTLPDVKDPPRATRLSSWDHFLNEEHNEPPSRYLAEAPTRTFDAILALNLDDDSPKIVQGDAYLEAMFELCMGRSSHYVTWDQEHGEFIPTATGFCISGCSPKLLGEFQDAASSLGRQMRFLSRSKGDNNHAATPSSLALSAILDSMTSAIRQYMESRRGATRTLLQLQELTHGPGALLAVMEQVRQVAQAREDDHEMLQALFNAAATMSTVYPPCRRILNQLLSTTAKPLLSQLACDLGFQADRINTPEPDEDTEALPWISTSSEDLVRLISETRASLRLSREQSVPTFDISTRNQAPAPDIVLSFTWDDLTALQIAAQDYENASLPTLSVKGKTDAGSVSLQDICGNDAAPQSPRPDPMVFQSYDFDRISTPFGVVDSANLKLVSECFSPPQHPDMSIPIPYDQVLAFSLTPLVNAQHRILSFSALSLLFKQCNIRAHLRFLWQLQLFGNGLFAARVSLALFDSDQSSGEGQRRDGNTTGLRLQSRDIWPPVSSELRLVLMGILSEHVPKSAAGELEDAVSFSLRDLPEAELERCRDVDSIYALDFLRMHYKPPNTLLETTISQDSLNKYDRIFRHLLRILRMKSVAQMLIREVTGRNGTKVPPYEHRFRIHMQHFVTVLADFSHNIAVNNAWRSFDETLAEIERKIHQSDYEGTLRLGQCLAHLKQLHEDMLDDVLRALLLKEKQAKARAIVEEMFGIMLRFAAAVRNREEWREGKLVETTRRLYDDFQRQLSALKDSLRGLGGVVEQLSLRLDMRGGVR